MIIPEANTQTSLDGRASNLENLNKNGSSNTHIEDCPLSQQKETVNTTANFSHPEPNAQPDAEYTQVHVVSVDTTLESLQTCVNAQQTYMANQNHNTEAILPAAANAIADI